MSDVRLLFLSERSQHPPHRALFGLLEVGVDFRPGPRDSPQSSTQCGYPYFFRIGGGEASVLRKMAMVSAFESEATSTQFSGVSSTTMSSVKPAAMRPRDAVTTYTLGSGKPRLTSHRCDWICAVSPEVVGRLVRKITSQRRSAARLASFLTMPGSVSSSVSQKPSIERTWRQSARRSRSLRSSSCCRGALSATSEGTMSAIDEGSWEGRRPGSRWGGAPKSFSASRTSAPSMSASTPSRSHPIRSAIRQP